MCCESEIHKVALNVLGITIEPVLTALVTTVQVIAYSNVV